MERQSTEHFGASENTLCDTKMVDTCHHAFVQAHGMYTTKDEP